MLGAFEVPTITVAQVGEALAVLGLDFHKVRQLHMHKAHIEVEVMCVNEDGKLMAAGDEMATATIRIPIVHPPFVSKKTEQPPTPTATASWSS